MNVVGVVITPNTWHVKFVIVPSNKKRNKKKIYREKYRKKRPNKLKKEKCNLQILVSLFALLRLVVSKPPSFLLSFSSSRALTSLPFLFLEIGPTS